MSRGRSRCLALRAYIFFQVCMFCTFTSVQTPCTHILKLIKAITETDSHYISDCIKGPLTGWCLNFRNIFSVSAGRKMLLDFRRWMAAARDRLYYDLEKYYDDYTKLEPHRCFALGSGPKREAIRHLLRQRQALMFMSTYQEETGRLPFLDLPAEIRNDIYRKALFCPGPPETWKLKLVGEQSRCQPLPRSDPFHQDLTISTLAMLSAMSKQIRNESQSFFWSTQKVEFVSATMPQHIAPNHFLTNTGPAARASIKELDRGSIAKPNYHSIRPQGCIAFQNLLVSLAFCTSLRRLRFNVYIPDIFLND
jgi:hypothetical protein